MRSKIIDGVEAAYKREKPVVFEIGDTVSVGVRVTEGNKTRVQPFIGVVIAKRGRGTGETFTVRRIVNNEGVERVFPVHAPSIVGVEVTRHGKIRRAKLYYLRDRVGKAQKLRERRAASHASDAGASSGAPIERSAKRSSEAVPVTA